MAFRSIMYVDPVESKKLQEDIPEFFVDLNLDQIVEGISRNFRDTQVKSWLLSPLHEKKDITYRQEVFTDLENTPVLEGIRVFVKGLRSVLGQLDSLGSLYDIQREGWFLELLIEYTTLVKDLLTILRKSEVSSDALTGLREYLEKYTDSPEFTHALQDISKTTATISRVRYSLTIKSDRVAVQMPDESGSDYSKEVKSVFSSFKDTLHQSRKSNRRVQSSVGYVQAEILRLIEKLYPKEIKTLRDFASGHAGFMNEVILNVFREFHFYISYLDYIERPKQKGLSFCMPKFGEAGRIFGRNCFDLALAAKLSKDERSIVTNDFDLSGNERIIVVTGPNNGGKTTFARSVGQMFYLASLGCPIPGSEALLTVPDGIFTHFEKSENLENLRGKLEDDLFRIKRIFDYSTSSSLVIINEMLSSTTVRDALFIGGRIMKMISEKACFCVFVTFLDEFSRYENAVSMVAQIDPEQPEVRTFKIVKEESNGLAYARSLARKYRISYEDIRRRMQA